MIFFIKLVIAISQNTNINKYIFKLIDNKLLFYILIYSLNSIK